MVSPVSMNDHDPNCEESSDRMSVHEYDNKKANEMDKTKVI